MIKKIIGAIVFLILVVAGYIGYRVSRPVSTVRGTYFYIRPGESLQTVRENLVYLNIANENDFKLACKILRFKKPKPGRYKIKDGMSHYQFARMLRSGNQELVKITVIKERTKESFAGKFRKKFDTDPDSLQMISFLNNNDSLKKYDVDSNTVMAVVMPYTYEVKWNTTPDKIFQQFYSAYKKFWTKERLTRADSLHLTPIEVTTLASIVEEETLKKSDKPNIASVYLNRVRQGWPLQADPTIKFAMKDFALKRIRGTHLKFESPYNTYLNKGVPPGPICTPTAESIDAVLNAPATEYMFFVASSKFDGSSVFTTNLSDHSKYARLYQQELTRRMDSAKKASANK